LYPRLYRANKGERDSAYPYLTLPFPRLAFRLINSDGNQGILFPATTIPYFPNASDAFVLGCVSPTADAHLDALVVFLLDADGQVTLYTRQPAAPLQCPAPPVVCDQHNECRSLP